MPANLKYSPDYPSLTPWLSEGHVDTGHKVYKNYTNTTALLFSEWSNGGEDITPREPSVIDGELIQGELG
ncbi:hypothetical protein [Mycobacterium sp. CnD-18-1]|uniref:hypothetical protein n=1 Tax=Mycobacterium sp. CnD-18-1 TaxID=2917744 RepID=UPI001EF2DA05|nr:hypothetical protein [Mycobacterium sp. CnD-18-1]MCG7607060.1 hypothetical protein [Mycobacterium sp. CnD-18-1]